MTFNYRFSVIPAGAIIDARLTPRALQILCLLGRHTNDQGWCSRSQVKMARELACSRSTVYDALELLVEAQWIEKRANGRGGRTPESADHPFAAYSYRVILDRDALPARLASDETEQSEPVEGAAQAAGGAGIAAGGADIAAPLEGISSKGIPTQPERDARARETRLSKLKTIWPTTAFDDQDQIERAWTGLSEAQQAEAVDRVEDYLTGLKRAKRTANPSLAKYLGQTLFAHLPPKTAAPAQSVHSIARQGSPEYQAYAVACAIAGERVSDAVVQIPGPVPADVSALAAFASDDGTIDNSAWQFLFARDHRLGHQDDNLDQVDRDKHQVAAWRQRVKEWTGRIPKGALTKREDGSYVMGIFVPMAWPAAKQAPPDQSAA